MDAQHRSINMKWHTSIRFWLTLIGALLLVPTGIATTPLQPGRTLIVNCVVENELTKKATIARVTQMVAARVTLSLDSAGTLLTINVQNISTSQDAMLYALDLGLPNNFVAINRLEATFSGFPAGARWLGPTDLSGATNGIGTTTMAAREVIAGRMEEYLKPQTSLSAGFLRPGQSGTIRVKITPTAAARQKSSLLQVQPVAYFLANAPNPRNNRIQIVSTSDGKEK